MKMNGKTNSAIRGVVFGGMMVAMSTALSFLTLFHLPQGGSITVCSTLPIMLFSWFFGVKWGMGAGFVHGVIQLLIGMGDLKGISGGAVIGSVFLDYLLAFTVLGLAGAFRNMARAKSVRFTLGCFLAGCLRYLCSFLSGWILWGAYADVAFAPGLLRGLSGQTLACFYSLLYNGVYMLPEIFLNCLAGFLVIEIAGESLENLLGKTESGE